MADRKSSNHGKRFIARKIVRVVASCCVVGIALACAGCGNESDRKARETAAFQANLNAELKAENAATARALQERVRADREASGVSVPRTWASRSAKRSRTSRRRRSWKTARPC